MRSEPVPRGESRLEPPVVLAVDDRRENLIALREVTKGLDMRLVEATDGRETLRLLLREEPALILLDVNMPGMDGFELARLIRGNPSTAWIPIIFVTASMPDTTRTFTGYEAGAVDYLHKPIDPAVLRSKVLVFLELEQRRRELRLTLRRLEDLNEHLEERVEERARALRESEARFSTAMHQSPIGMTIVLPDGTWADFNEALCRTVGYSRAEMLEISSHDITHPDDLAAEQEQRRRLLAGEIETYRAEKRYIHRDGHTIWVQIDASLVRRDDDTPRYVITQEQEITERRHTETALRSVATELVSKSGREYFQDAARKLAAILDADAAFVCSVPTDAGSILPLAWVEDGVVTEPSAYRAAGTPCEVVLGHSEALVVRGGVAERFPADRYLADHGIEAYAAEPLRDEQDRTLGHIGVMYRRPLTTETAIVPVLGVFSLAVSAEMVQQRHRDRFRRLFEFAPDALVKFDEAGTIQLVNHTAEEMFQRSRDELVGQPVASLLRQEDAAHLLRRTARIHPRDPSTGSSFGISRLRGLRRDGSDFPTEIALAARAVEGGMMITAAIRDVGERESLESQLRQAQKMEGVGRLAASVAHDFNNVLSLIATTTELALGTPGHEVVRDDLRVIRDAAGDAVGLTRQLLTFSRQQPARPVETNLDRVVGDVVPLLRRVLGKRVELTVRRTDDLPPVRLDEAQFRQVIMNLVVNALDAMPEGGTLRIETSSVMLDEAYEPGHPGVSVGPHVLLAITDTGEGMDADTREQVFEPFFTTKEPGKGTGLGLSTAYGIVKQARGDIRVYSEPGVGTTFRIYIPIADATPAPAPVPTEDPNAPTAATPDGVEAGRHAGQILVVDDDGLVLDSVCRVLADAGYAVLAASDAEEALELMAGAAGPVDLLISDVVMPDMNGQQLADAVRRIAPTVKVLFSSGYPGEVLAEQGLLDEGFHLIEKPYSIRGLTEAVRRVLDEA